MTASPEEVLEFWRAAGPDKWFHKDVGFDQDIRARFLATYEEAAAGMLADWEATPDHTLALLIVLDQFPRNMFRGAAKTFAADPLARAVADSALARGIDHHFEMPERMFFYLPFEHSETLADQHRCVALFRSAGNADLLKWAELHADVIRRFGRFPHRNALLGRAITADEQDFLNSGGFAG